MAEELPTVRNKIYPDQDDPSTFGIGDLLSKIASEGLPANVRAYLETAVRHVLDLPNATWGNEVFTENQLEMLRDAIKNRTSDQLQLTGTPLDPDWKSYVGPLADVAGIGMLMQEMYNDDWILATSLSGVQIREDDKNFYISDPFDFAGNKRTVTEAIKAADAYGREYTGGDFLYQILRNLGPTISQEDPEMWLGDPGGEVKPPPMFELTIPKEGPIPRAMQGVLATDPSPKSIPRDDIGKTYASGGFVDKPLYESARLIG